MWDFQRRGGEFGRSGFGHTVYIFDLYWVCFAAQKMKIEFENLEKTTFLILSYPILSHQNESIFYLVGLTKTIVRVSKSFQN